MRNEPTVTFRSPRAIRDTRFSLKLRGYDESEVHAFQEQAAHEIQKHQDEEARLRAEIERLRALTENEEVKERAVALFSQAQTVADQLIEEAVEHAKDLMMAARAQQREILAEKRPTAHPAPVASPVSVSPLGGGDLPYVQTYAQVAAVQLRSIIDALAEQVEKLDDASRSTQLTLEPVQDPSRSGGNDESGEPLIWASMMPRQGGALPSGW